MNREQAQKWIADNNKKPAISYNGNYYWISLGLEPEPRFKIPDSIYKKMSPDSKWYETEVEAYEDLVQALMKLDEPEVDAKIFAHDYAEKYLQKIRSFGDQEQNGLYSYLVNSFIAGYEAAKTGDR